MDYILKVLRATKLGDRIFFGLFLLLVLTGLFNYFRSWISSYKNLYPDSWMTPFILYMPVSKDMYEADEFKYLPG